MCDSAASAQSKAKPEMLHANTLIDRIGGGSDQVNLLELVSYLKESKLARKVSGFAEKTARMLAKKGQHLIHSMTLLRFSRDG